MERVLGGRSPSLEAEGGMDPWLPVAAIILQELLVFNVYEGRAYLSVTKKYT